MKNRFVQNEIRELTVLAKWFLTMFVFTIFMLSIFVIGFILIIVFALQFRAEFAVNLSQQFPNALLYSVIAYIVVLVVFIFIYFLIGWKINRLLNKGKHIFKIYENNMILKNPFKLIKEFFKIKRAIMRMNSGESFEQVVETIF